MSAFWSKKEDKNSKEDSLKKEGGLPVNKEKSDEKKSENKKKDKKKERKKGKKKNSIVIPGEKAALINKVLVKPMISEAVMRAQELGKYTFKVNKNVSKREIALAVESMYKVSVVKVNVLNYKAERKNFRGKSGLTKSYKKAIITLKKGDKIKLFS